ncbi:MAG TPA: SDR family NAD(P)-dependent oxidoreductase [Vicinamibacterales bacterium]|jgi:NAD(P)-dependent dehydrogenase (short-subunit alcohol dehydrogenase family)|nr:SDR family NAD(P)-dependent oxidoreductase [Vicinamibacterales bacterium]
MLTQQQKRMLAFSAVGVGAFAAAQMWRRRAPYDFAGKSVVITGGSRGLGLVMARQIADQGARLTLVARDEEELTRAMRDIQARQPFAEVAPVTADIRSRYQAERAVAMAIDRFGTVDVLINNAGIIQVGPIDHMKVSDYEDAMLTHFWGPLYMILAAIPYMRRQGAGRIVNISSIGGRISVPHLVPYSASKFALAGLSDGLRAELARHNILVTSVYPGLMRTGSPVNAMFKGHRPQEYAWFAISDSLPLASIAPERAARQIIRACRYGDAELVITVQAKLAILARTLAPELFAETMALINQLLPGPAPADGDEAREGRESESEMAGPSAPLTARTYREAEKNNEM